MAKLHTLTVPDFLWLNLQICQKPQQYHAGRLEEAVFAQYQYGESADVLSQASSFLVHFRRLRPFTHGNDACAFIGAAAFLKMNGFRLRVDARDAADWATAVWGNAEEAKAAIESKVAHDDHHHHGDVPPRLEICEELLETYREATRTLTEREPVAALL